MTEPLTCPVVTLAPVGRDRAASATLNTLWSMNKHTPALALITALLLTGCSAGTDTPEPSTPAANAPATDVTADVQDAVGGDLAALITAAESPEEGRVNVSTSITDPRTDDSQEAADALSICEAVAGMPGVTYVSVAEEDGTTFVLFGHPSVAEGECAEV